MLRVQSLGRFALTMVLGLAVAAWAARAEARGGGHGGGHHGGGHAGGHHGGHEGHHTHTHHGEHHHDGHHDHHHDGQHVHHHHYFHGGGWGGNGWGGWGWAGVAAPLGYAAGRAYAVPGYGGYGGYYGGTDTAPQVNVNNASGATSGDDSDSDDDEEDTDAQDADDDEDDDDGDDADSDTPKDDADGRGAPPVDYEAPLPKDRGAIHIKLPDPSATITFDGEPILGRGPDRLILTPSIQAGKPFKYQVQATWTRNGQSVTELREGTVVAGKYALANFDAPANATPTARTSQATSATQPGTK